MERQSVKDMVSEFDKRIGEVASELTVGYRLEVLECDGLRWMYTVGGEPVSSTRTRSHSTSFSMLSTQFFPLRGAQAISSADLRPSFSSHETRRKGNSPEHAGRWSWYPRSYSSREPPVEVRATAAQNDCEFVHSTRP